MDNNLNGKKINVSQKKSEHINIGEPDDSELANIDPTLRSAGPDALNGSQREDATASRQVRQVSRPSHSIAEPDVTIASHQNRPPSSKPSRDRPANSRCAASHERPNADITTKRYRELQAERRYSARRQDRYKELLDTYNSLPEGYRQSLDERVGKQEGKRNQKPAQADVFARATLVIKDFKSLVFREVGTDLNKVEIRQQEELMAIDGQTKLDIMTGVMDPAFPDFAGPSEIPGYFSGGFNGMMAQWNDEIIDDGIAPADF